MRGVLAQAGKAPATGWARRRGAAPVVQLEPRTADATGMRLAALVAADRGISVRSLFHPERCSADVALARQLGMYLMRVALGRRYADVGRFFGRDRTTVSHACGVIEELREDAAFDERVARLELALAPEAGHVEG